MVKRSANAAARRRGDAGPRTGTEELRRANDLLRSIQVRWVQVHFTDLMGGLRSFTVPSGDLLSGKVWQDGIGFDGASVKGFASVESSDLRAVPDPSTLASASLCDGAHILVRAMADLYNPLTGERLEADPRFIADRAMRDLAAAGFDESWLSPELEFSLFRSPEDASARNDLWGASGGGGAGDPRMVAESLLRQRGSDHRTLPGSSYFAAPPADETDAFRNDLASGLEDIGIPVKFHHHEAGIGQVEVEIKAMRSAVRMGDACVTYKHLARLVAQHHGFVPTFMAKPIQADAGNGMHVHISLWKGGRSAFYDPDDEYNMSQTMRYFVGGLLEHARASAAVTNPTVNSYKRLVPDHEAPMFIAWSPVNRTALVRIPARHSNPGSINCEPRHADPSANPYLLFAVLLQSGLDGIKRKLDPGSPVNENLFKMPPERRRSLGIASLPASLGEALEAMESDDFVKRAIGPHAQEIFLGLKKKEWAQYCSGVTGWEHATYFHV